MVRHRKTFRLAIATACASLAVLTAVPMAGAVQPGSTMRVAQGLDTLELSTRDGQIYPRGANQGWWSDRVATQNSNDNYIVGRCCRGTYHNFFTFDLSDVSRHIVHADLNVFTAGTRGASVFRYGLFDVSTPADVVNLNNTRNLDIYEDLASGTSYGTFEITRAQREERVLLTLNRAAVKDMNEARGGYFTVGGTLLSPTEGKPGPYLFGSSQDHYAKLVVQTTPSH